MCHSLSYFFSAVLDFAVVFFAVVFFAAGFFFAVAFGFSTSSFFAVFFAAALPILSISIFVKYCRWPFLTL